VIAGRERPTEILAEVGAASTLESSGVMSRTNHRRVRCGLYRLHHRELDNATKAAVNRVGVVRCHHLAFLTASCLLRGEQSRRRRVRRRCAREQGRWRRRRRRVRRRCAREQGRWRRRRGSTRRTLDPRVDFLVSELGRWRCTQVDERSAGPVGHCCEVRHRRAETPRELHVVDGDAVPLPPTERRGLQVVGDGADVLAIEDDDHRQLTSRA
jgi:hypothetical protein